MFILTPWLGTEKNEAGVELNRRTVRALFVDKKKIREIRYELRQAVNVRIGSDM